jgi:nitrite reductase/ring-hydroxylating ferredoxin subunit
MKVRILAKVFEERDHILTWFKGRPVLVVKRPEGLYAIDAVCAHMGCALLTEVDGYYAVCPAHKAKYDIRTGEMVEKPVVRPEVPCEFEAIKPPLKRYKARITEDGFLDLEEA